MTLRKYKLGFLGLCASILAACTSPELAERSATPDITLPPVRTFSEARPVAPRRSNQSIAQDFLDLSFELESGRALEVFTRFEGPITVRVTGDAPASLEPDLRRLLDRFRDEARIEIQQVPSSQEASITLAVISRRDLQRVVPQAACFVAPNVSSWPEFLSERRSAQLDWTNLRERTRLSIFLPGDVAPQEVRDCLHEELAQSIGPLNDLYRLTDSVFNDDNFHTVLTGFDMLVLRAYYAPELQSGMTRGQVARFLPGILNRINPRGQGLGTEQRRPTSRAWISAIEQALGPRTTPTRRRLAAQNAVDIARLEGWNDNRLAFSLYARGRLTIGSDPELALASFLRAGTLYSGSSETQLQEAHVSMQLAAFALSAGQAEVAIDLVDTATPAVRDGENAALLASLLLVKSQALEFQGNIEEAAAVRTESLGWARYGFSSDQSVRERAREIARLAPDVPSEPQS